MVLVTNHESAAIRLFSGPSLINHTVNPNTIVPRWCWAGKVQLSYYKRYEIFLMYSKVANTIWWHCGVVNWNQEWLCWCDWVSKNVGMHMGIMRETKVREYVVEIWYPMTDRKLCLWPIVIFEGNELTAHFMRPSVQPPSDSDIDRYRLDRASRPDSAGESTLKSKTNQRGTSPAPPHWRCPLTPHRQLQMAVHCSGGVAEHGVSRGGK